MLMLTPWLAGERPTRNASHATRAFRDACRSSDTPAVGTLLKSPSDFLPYCPRPLRKLQGFQPTIGHFPAMPIRQRIVRRPEFAGEYQRLILRVPASPRGKSLPPPGLEQSHPFFVLRE